ncbi:MAG: DUF502 domain-containing protein [Puniceicoccaceae bacterium]|nr:MAG: DUF502 domain-containing protein [Puniceicoccaceae bacterium]
MHSRVLKSIRTAFLSGVILLAPLGVTLLVFGWLVERVGGNFRDYFFFFVPVHLLEQSNLQILWNFLATLIVLVLVTLLGYLSKYVLAKSLWSLGESILRNVPVINAVYNTVKQIVDTFSTQNRAIFSKVVLIQFPRPGAYALGFLTNRAKGEPQGRTKEELWNVFVPTTPNPTSGFLILLPRREITELDMTITDGMKAIISGGAVVPAWDEQAQAEIPRLATNPQSLPAEAGAAAASPGDGPRSS